uniref:Uncharacterized protein n=1 Tax=Panagrolaimus davidi TaxID=227884 RepID=A0A914PJ94_9BILA
MTFKFKVVSWQHPVPNGNITGYFDLRLPTWLNGAQGLTSSKQMLGQLRIFIEALIVLLVLTGYREAIVKFIKFTYFILRNPRKVFQQFKPNVSQTKVTVIGSKSK